MTVQGGCESLDLSINAIAAVQFPWQSSNVPMIPPLTIPGNAWCSNLGENSNSRPLSVLIDLIFRPFSFAGPQPKQMLFGACFSWTESESASAMIVHKRVKELNHSIDFYNASS